MSSSGYPTSSTSGGPSSGRIPKNAQTLSSVGADQAINSDLGSPAGDLEGEGVLPVGPADMQKRKWRCVADPARFAQQKYGVVVDWCVPELSSKKRAVQRELTEKPVAEIEEMHALIDDFSAS